jgi:hypothetical protein
MSARCLLSVGPVPQVDVIWDLVLGRASAISQMMIDDDGSGDPHNDPDFQARTSYRNEGPDGVPRWLNADLVPYIVLPPRVILAFTGIVLGCQAFVINAANGLSSPAVVGDTSDDRPSRILGEGSIALAKAIGVPPSPTTGGESRRIISFAFFPGRPAVVGGVTYALQKYALGA